MLDFGGLRVEELAKKLVSIGCDRYNVFQGHQTSMTIQFKNKVVPFIIRVHYFAHQTNLGIIAFSNVPLMHQLEGILQNMFFFFTIQKHLQNSKRLQIFSTPRATRFYEMSKANRS
jgi:aspartate-semialdehyde dehydrogenase